MDAAGMLSLRGRTKDTININGIKFDTCDIQAGVERVMGIYAVRIICFPSRTKLAHTEQVTIVFVPKRWDAHQLHQVHNKVVEICLSCTGAQPIIVGLRDTSSLPQTTLGKIPGRKLRVMFESGQFDEALEEYKSTMLSATENGSIGFWLAEITDEEERDLLEDFKEVRGNLPSSQSLGPETPVFETGFTLVDIIRLKLRLDRRLSIDVPIITLMKNPTARLLAGVLRQLTKALHDNDVPSQASAPSRISAIYDPVVTFRENGDKTPLWLVHPGVGEVLVFVGVAQQLASDDRPVYALRARGFEADQSVFASVFEMVNVYTQAIRARQPNGPYALAGYSYGGMVAFEIAKCLRG